MAGDLPIRSFERPADWEEWLSGQPADSAGIWLKIAKKGSGIVTVDYAAALESALCYGWIDGQKKGFDELYFLQKFTPRRANSPWSRVNRLKAEALAAAGRMQPGGLRQMELAQANGRWAAAYDSQASMAVPPDLQAALELNPAAARFFETLDSANRYAILYRLQTAVKPATRQSRLAKFIAMLEAGQKLHP